MAAGAANRPPPRHGLTRERIIRNYDFLPRDDPDALVAEIAELDRRLACAEGGINVRDRYAAACRLLEKCRRKITGKPANFDLLAEVVTFLRDE